MATYNAYKSKWRGGWKGSSDGGPLEAPSKQHKSSNNSNKYNKYGPKDYKHDLNLGKKDWRSDRNNQNYSGNSDFQKAYQKAMRIQRYMRYGKFVLRKSFDISPFGRAADFLGEAYDLWQMWKQYTAEQPGKWILPANLYIACQEPGLDIGYGTAVEQWSSCSGGNCLTGFTNPGSNGVHNLPTTDYAFQAWRQGQFYKLWNNFSIGPWNSSVGLPQGRYAQRMKICSLGAKPRPLGNEEVIWRHPRPAEAPKWTPMWDRMPSPTHREFSPGASRRRAPSPRPYEWPAFNRHIPPKGPPTTTRDFHKRLPPPPKVRERKDTHAGQGPLNKFMKFYGGLTEAKDTADALADALPDSRCKGLGLSDTISCLMDNWRDIDPAKAAANLLVNHAQDKAIGAFGHAVGAGSANAANHGMFNRPFGLGFGGRFTQGPYIRAKPK